MLGRNLSLGPLLCIRNLRQVLVRMASGPSQAALPPCTRPRVHKLFTFGQQTKTHMRHIIETHDNVQCQASGHGEYE